MDLGLAHNLRFVDGSAQFCHNRLPLVFLKERTCLFGLELVGKGLSERLVAQRQLLVVQIPKFLACKSIRNSLALLLSARTIRPEPWFRIMFGNVAWVGNLWWVSSESHIDLAVCEADSRISVTEFMLDRLLVPEASLGVLLLSQ